MLYLGIDVSKAKLDCALIRPDSDKKLNKSFPNSTDGVAALLTWLSSRSVARADLSILMEPTGVYHELAALALVEAGCTVSLVNPARLRSYASAIGVASKTDYIDSVVLARFGASEHPPAWQPPPPAARELTALLARREALCQDIQREENRLEKAQCAVATPKAVSRSLTETIVTKRLLRMDKML